MVRPCTKLQEVDGHLRSYFTAFVYHANSCVSCLSSAIRACSPVGTSTCLHQPVVGLTCCRAAPASSLKTFYLLSNPSFATTMVTPWAALLDTTQLQHPELLMMPPISLYTALEHACQRPESTVWDYSCGHSHSVCFMSDAVSDSDKPSHSHNIAAACRLLNHDASPDFRLTAERTLLLFRMLAIQVQH